MVGIPTLIQAVLIWIPMLLSIGLSFTRWNGLALDNIRPAGTANYTFDFDVTAWGWIHLLLGVLVAVAGWAVFSGKLWGRMVGIVLASLSLIANFVFLPHYPLWSIIVIALDVAVIAALCHYDESAADRA